MSVPRIFFPGGCWAAGVLVMFLSCDLEMVTDTRSPRPGGPMGVRQERVADRGTQVLHSDFASPTATSPRVSSELEQARPQTSGEEELQLQLALAMSKEEADQVLARLGGVAGRGSESALFPSPCLASAPPALPLCPPPLWKIGPTPACLPFFTTSGPCLCLPPSVCARGHGLSPPPRPRPPPGSALHTPFPAPPPL